MRHEIEDGILRFYLAGRIDSNNAPALEKEMLEAADGVPDASVVLDASALEYISSAGLRILMKLMKRTKEKLAMENVSSDVYEILDVTGFTELMDVKKQLRTVYVDGRPVIGQGGNGTIYRLDEDTIVKVYKPWMKLADIEREQNFARTAFVNGIPSVIAFDVVRVGECLGVVFEMLKSDTLGHAMVSQPEKLEELTDRYVGLAKALHETHVPEGSFARIQDVYHARIDNLTPWCTEEEIALLHSITDDIPLTDTVTHNDLHPGNIMLQGDELVLIDMPEVTMGPPICDLTSVYRDLIAAPAGAGASSIERSTGMPAELCMRVGNIFFEKYTGITDPAALEKYYQQLGLLFAFNTTVVTGSGSENAGKMAPIIMDKLLREVLIPNEQAVRYLFRTM